MFDNAKRSARAVKSIAINRRNHKREMKQIEMNEQIMLDAIDQICSNLRKR